MSVLAARAKPHRAEVCSCGALRLFLTVVSILLALAGCSGESGGPEVEAAPASVYRGQAAGSVAPGGAAGVTVEALYLKASRRISRTVFEYDFDVSLLNIGSALGQVAVKISAVGAGTTVIDGGVSVDGLPVGTTVVSADTITLRHDRTTPFSLAALVWNITASAPLNSEVLIAQALAAGEIDADTALVYRTFAAFGDPRLPAAYRGTELGMHSGVLYDVIQRYDSLSAAHQAVLLPFLQRPSDQGSWLDPALTTGSAKAAASDRKYAQNIVRRCVATLYGWTSVDRAGSSVRVWYYYDKPGQDAMATKVLDYIELTVRPALVGRLGFKEPSSDAGLACNGGDGKLDVYLLEGLGNYGETIADTSDKYSSPVYMLINDSLDDVQLQHTVSHEYMHAIHWAYRTKAPQEDYGWFRDAIANWATDEVYPTNKALNKMASCHLRSPHLALEDRSAGYCTDKSGAKRDYGAYLPLRFFAKTIGVNIVRSILAATEFYGTAAEAMDKALPNGLAKHWPLFGARLWNQEATDQLYGAATFKAWDGLSSGNAPVYKPVLAPDLPNTILADLQGQPKDDTALASELEHLSNKYYHFAFTEEATRSVMFHNTFQPKRKQGVKVSVRAFYKPENQNWQEEDWSDYEWIGFCRDFKDQRLEELVIVISSTEWQPSRPKVKADEAPRLKRNNIGCWEFSGTVTRSYSYPTWKPGGRAELTFVARFSNESLGEPTQYTDEATGRLRVPLMGPEFRSGTWTMLESFVEGGDVSCSFSLNSGGSEAAVSLGGTSGGQIDVDVFDEALPAYLRQAAESRYGSAERAYSITGVSTRVVTGQVTGPPECGPFYQSALGNWLLTSAEPAKSPVVDANGRLKASFVAVDYGGGHELKYSWDLVPKRQP